MDKLLNANVTLPGRDLPQVGVASRSSTRRRGRAPLMLTRLPSFRSGRAALRVLTRAHRMHGRAQRRQYYFHVGFAWIASGIAWALLGGFSLTGLGGLAWLLIGLAWLAIGFAIG
jgi:hypothetical protein